MLVCPLRGLSLLGQHPPRSLGLLPLRLPYRPARLLFLSSLHHSAAAAMGENSAAGKDAKGKAPTPLPTVVPDEAHVEAVTQKRIRLFKEIQTRLALERLNIGGEPIKITLPDGAVKEGQKWISTPMDIAKEISSGLAASYLIAQVNGTLWDMDDAHIFCRESQIKDEVKGVLEFINYVYEIFGFKYELELSTRPEKYLGDIETWNKAEEQLTEALNEFGKPWQIMNACEGEQHSDGDDWTYKWIGIFLWLLGLWLQ